MNLPAAELKLKLGLFSTIALYPLMKRDCLTTFYFSLKCIFMSVQWVIIVLDNGLAPIWCQAIILNNDDS